MLIRVLADISTPGKKKFTTLLKVVAQWILSAIPSTVQAGDVVLIPDGAFHRVHAGDNGCYFVCVFDGKRVPF